jgi:hypothetical protein
MRHLLNQISLMLSTVFLVSCASAIPPARIGDYVSSERQAGDGVFTTMDQRPLEAGLVVVSDMAAPGAAPDLPEEALVRLGESLQRDLGRAIPIAITEMILADRIGRSRMVTGPSSLNWGSNTGSSVWPLWWFPAPSRNIP